MKILIFLPSIERGGCEQAALNIANVIRGLGNEVFVCHPQVPGTMSLRDSFLSIGCRYARWRCGERALSMWPADKDQYNEAMTLLHRTAPDVVVFVLPEPTSAFGFIEACIDSQKRSFVVFQLCDEPFRAPRAIFDAATKLPTDRLPIYVSVSKESVSRLANGLNVAESEIHVLRNFSGQRLLDQPPGEFSAAERHTRFTKHKHTVLTIGRITRQKGYEYLVQAASLVTRHLPESRFVWVGEGEDDVSFRRLIETHGLTEYFTLPGWSTRVDLYLQSADVFVLPSLWEGTPLSISEAMAHGCPIIASAVGGVPEMLSADEAWLVQPADPVSLQKAIIFALENPRLSSRKAARARIRWTRDSEESRRQLIRLITS